MIYIYLILVLSTLLIRDTSVIDLIGIQWLYLSLINTLSLAYNFLKPARPFNCDKILKAIIPLILIVFAISCFNSTVIKLSLIDIARYFVIILTVYNFLLFSGEKPINFLIISRIFSIFLLIDILEFLFIYYQNFNNLIPRASELKAFTSNININAFIILLKIPFLFYLILKDIKWIRILAFVILFISVYNLFWIQSRASFVALFSIFTILVYINFQRNKKFIIYSLIILISAFSLSNYHISNNTNYSSSNVSRIASITDISGEDESISSRLRYYKGGIQQIKKTPIIGVGIGNWKINSINYDRQYMDDYTVPYHMHNDFLQIFVETGLFGFLLYTCFFIYLFYILVNKIIKEDFNVKTFILLMCLITYVIDANLNFPHERSEIQSIFPLIIGLILYFEKK